jgi:FMN-dependent NADH-azoreductase
MTHLLQIDSSPRSQRSHSRKLTGEFVEAWKQAHPGDLVTYRDIGRNPIPHLDELTIAAAYTPPEQRSPELEDVIRFSDALVDEFLAAHLYVIGLPMYNFSIPSTLKAYIDQIVRIGRTFAFDPENAVNPYQPLVMGKQMVIISARGGSGFGAGGRAEMMNYQTPYLATIFGFIGITDIRFIDLENGESSAPNFANAIASARTQIAELVKTI